MIQRTDYYLQLRLQHIWTTYFSDVERINPVSIEFGRNAKTRLGSIKYHKDTNTSVITINGLLQLSEVPESVIDTTIAHELTHYAHGFNSTHPQKFQHPHQGGIISKEFKTRGLIDQNKHAKTWLKDNWPTLVTTHLPQRTSETTKTKLLKQLLEHI